MEMPLGFLRKDHTREKKEKKIADANMATLVTMHRNFLFMFHCLIHQGKLHRCFMVIIADTGDEVVSASHGTGQEKILQSC